MLIWKGWGILVVIVGFAWLLLAEFATESFLGDDAYFQEHTWPMSAALFLTAAVLWPLGTRMNGGGASPHNDAEPGAEPTVRKVHSFFFIRLQHWAPILAVLGVLLLLG